MYSTLKSVNVSVYKKRSTAVLLPSRFCLAIIIVAAHDIMGDIMTLLEDLVEVEPLIFAIDLATLEGDDE
jgi:hypothetical protein